jgi:hypothetical protein
MFAASVALALQPELLLPAMQRLSSSVKEERMSASWRWLGFHIGDWLILAAGIALVGILQMMF